LRHWSPTPAPWPNKPTRSRGSSKACLLSDLCEAIDAIHQAGKILALASPNARDYYVQGAGAFEKAQDQHQARMKKLREVVTELETIAEAVQFRD
jgi:hypothetical protein